MLRVIMDSIVVATVVDVEISLTPAATGSFGASPLSLKGSYTPAITKKNVGDT